MLTDDNRSEALAPLRQSFQQTLERGIAEANDDVDRQAFRAVASAYAAFLQQIEASRHQNLTLLEDNPLSQSFNKVRGLMTDMQGAAYDKIRDTELRSRDRASLLAGLLGLTAIAVLLIGFISTASRDVSASRSSGCPPLPTRSAAVISTSPCRPRRSPSCRP